MKYTGRIIGVLVMLLVIISIRIYAYIFLEYSLGTLLIPGVFYLAIAFMLGKQYDQVKFYSERDSLTGLYNRRFVTTFFPKMRSQMEKKNEKLSVLLLDCDNFKIINDTYGHMQGDQVLMEVAALLLAKIRQEDLAVRWGGDEFLLIAAYTDEAKVKAIMERLKKELTKVSEKLQINISASGGYAVYPTEAKTLDELIQVADTKLYLLKSANS
ncbi:MAG: GGDEF domain-containing protein [Pelosinus sp.]|nr:GGDEF domain-containing protein [Pelosinus sp.]